MRTTYGHLTYCTNIHPGESWEEHFQQLQTHIPAIKAAVSPDQPMGIGLRVANLASLQLSKEDTLQAFKSWLQEQDCYVFTMNGFPYGSFHDTVVKDQVHTPDWTQADRVAYSIRLFRILAALLPAGMNGGISTSPLSYKPWYSRCQEERDIITGTATLHLLSVVEQLVRTQRAGGPVMHIDIEPEPDGLLENTQEYIHWYTNTLLPAGIPFLQDKFGVSAAEAGELIRTHVQLCYDVCHFALEYETPEQVLSQLRQFDLRVGKLQISAALRATMPEDAEERRQVMDAFAVFNEPVYLHQVIARHADGQTHYPDLPSALEAAAPAEEWRSHFHVPVFLEEYGLLGSTNDDIKTVLALQRQQPFTDHLEVETYTWDVLPADLKLPVAQSIARELTWVNRQLEL